MKHPEPESTKELGPSEFLNIAYGLVGNNLGQHLLKTNDANFIAGVMSNLYAISTDHPTDSNKSISACEHPRYHDFMGHLLKLWKKAS